MMLSLEEKYLVVEQFARNLIAGDRKGLLSLLDKEGEFEYQTLELKTRIYKRVDYIDDLLTRRLVFLKYNDVLDYKIIRQYENDVSDWVLLINDGFFPYMAYVDKEDCAAGIAFQFNGKYISFIRFCFSYPGCIRQSFLERFEQEVDQKLKQFGENYYEFAAEAVFMRKYGEIPMPDFENRNEYIFWNHYINTTVSFTKKPDKAYVNTAGIPLDDDEFFSTDNNGGAEWDEEDDDDEPWFGDDEPPF